MSVLTKAISLFALAFTILTPVIALGFDTGKPVGKIALEGLSRADSNTIRFYIHSKVGEKFESATVQEDIRRIFKLGFFDDIVIDVEEMGEKLVLTYIFREKPFVRDIIITGSDEMEEIKVKAKVKTMKGAFFRQDRTPWDKSRIKGLYRSKGFYFSEVSIVVHKIPGNQVDVEYIIDEGEKISISQIRFRGIAAFSPAVLRGVIETDTAGKASFITDDGAYKKDVLKADRLRIESFYHDNGYIKIRVGEPEVEVDREKNRVYVVFPIEEGERYRVGEVEVEGDEVYSAETLREKLHLEEGDVFNRSRFRQDIFDITDLYSRKGYAFANVIPSVSANDDGNVVNMKIKVSHGRKVYIGKISFVGNEETRDRVIRRQFLLQEGELFNSEKLRRTRTRVNKLGFFDNVEVEQRSRREEDLIDLNLNLMERNTGQLSFSVGYSSVENLLLQGQVKWTNLFGRGQELAVTLDTSSRRADFSIGFTEPAIFDRELSGHGEVYNNSFEYDAYKSRSTGASVRTGRGLSEFTWARIGYRYEKNDVTIFDSDVASIFLREQEGETTSGSLYPSITYDSRNDAFNPTSGQKIYGKAEVSGFGGEERYYKVTGEYTVYQSLPVEFVAMIHGKLGYGGGYEEKTLPISKRYFLGGPRSLRGFTYRDVGPLDENGEAIGGEAVAQLNFELQYRFSRFFRGFLFYDRGNVYSENDMQNNTTDKFYDLENMRHSWGFGVHFFSPMGPITMAYGFKLDQRYGESPNEFHFTIGGAF